VATAGIANGSEVKDPEGGSIAEVVRPSNPLGGHGIMHLFEGLPEDQRPKPGENLEQRQRRNHGVEAPGVGKDKWEAEKIISHGRHQTAQASMNHRPCQGTASHGSIENTQDTQEQQRGQKDSKGEGSHGHNVIELHQERGNRGQRKGKDRQPSAERPKVTAQLGGRMCTHGIILEKSIRLASSNFFPAGKEGARLLMFPR
jgi:hypothetical protein